MLVEWNGMLGRTVVHMVVQGGIKRVASMIVFLMFL